MNLSNAAFDLAALRSEQEREAAIAVASLALSTTGAPVCVGCESEIRTERRQALPSAIRCVNCQTLFEKSKLRRRA